MSIASYSMCKQTQRALARSHVCVCVKNQVIRGEYILFIITFSCCHYIYYYIAQSDASIFTVCAYVEKKIFESLTLTLKSNLMKRRKKNISQNFIIFPRIFNRHLLSESINWNFPLASK